MVFMVRQHMYARNTGAWTKQKKKESQTMGEQKLYWEPLSFQKYQHCCIQDSKEVLPLYVCCFVKKTFFTFTTTTETVDS